MPGCLGGTELDALESRSGDGRGPLRLTPEPLSAVAWEPYGWLPVPDTDPADGSNRLEFAWDDVHVNLISHSRQEVERSGRYLRCRTLYRHASHTQVLMALNVKAVLVVAPADATFGSEGELGGLRAFGIAPLEAVVLKRGTWHWGPFPVGNEPVRLFNIQGLRYLEDNTSVDLGAAGIVVEVEIL